MIEYFLRHYDKLFGALLEHCQLVFITMLCSLLVAFLFTILAVYRPKIGEALIQIFSVLYSVPSLAFLAILIPFTGLGTTTAVIVMTVYNQYLLLRNFLAGLMGIDAAIAEAATGLGMTKWQILLKIRMPLARRSLVTGIQLAVVSTVGIGTIAAMINAGGLGTILFDGLRTLNVNKILWGTIFSAGLALFFNGVFQAVEKRL